MRGDTDFEDGIWFISAKAQKCEIEKKAQNIATMVC